ncbi:MAG: hypothetical protein QNK33_05600 [Bacteroidales bacterium]|nr:hypothetical protein [Bacteroidales bacterium]
MFENNYNLKAAYKTIKILFAAILAGPIIFSIVALVIVENPSRMAFDFSQPLNLALILVTLGTLLMGNLLARKTFARVTPDFDTKKRIATYQIGLIIRLASYKVVALFSIVVFILTTNILVLLFVFVAVVGMAQNYPTPGRIRTLVGIKEIDLL